MDNNWFSNFNEDVTIPETRVVTGNCGKNYLYSGLTAFKIINRISLVCELI